MALSFLQFSLVWTAIIIVAFAAKTFLTPKRKGPPLPPGPKPLPLVGNVNDLPTGTTPEYFHWTKHNAAYGPITSVTVLGQTIVFLHTSAIAFELLEKRAVIHSNRPFMEFACNEVNLQNWMAFIHSGPELRAHRKDIHNVIGTKNLVEGFNELQSTVTRRCLLCTYRKPETLADNIQTAIAATILQLTYGYKLDQRKGHDPLVELIDQHMQNFSDACIQGKWLVDVVPVLKYLPEWFPGGGFKKIGRRYRRTTHEVTEKPYAFAKREVQRETASESLLRTLLTKEGSQISAETEARLKNTAVNLYAGGADTVSCIPFNGRGL
jgi:hypothetical protein